MCWKTAGVVLLALATLVSVGDGHADSHMHQGHADNRLRDPKVVHDAEHIKEHYKGRADFNESGMSPEELEFHYFRLHDTDDNNKLDGLEILKALTHMLAQHKPETIDRSKFKTSEEMQKEMERRQAETLESYTEIIDNVLKDDDLDDDGYLTYAEYVLARRRDEEIDRKHDERRPGKRRNEEKRGRLED